MLSLVLLSSLGCRQPAQKAPVDDFPPAHPAGCRIEESPIAALGADLPAMWAVEVGGVAKDGIVMAHYDGCTLKVLTGCVGEGAYELIGEPPRRESFEVSSQAELDTKLRFAPSDLAAEVAAKNHIRVELTSIGSRVAKGPPTGLRGDCSQATHYVRVMRVGAYAVDAVEPNGSKRRLRAAGDPEVCARPDVLPDACQSLLSVSLEPAAQKIDAFAGVKEGTFTPLPPSQSDQELCARYREDLSKVQRIAKMDANIVSEADKARLRAEFEAVYAASRRDLERLDYCER